MFLTREFEQAAGVRPSSASRALGELAAGGLVGRIRRGTWRNFAVEWPGADVLLVGSGPVSHHWTPEWETELEVAYSGLPRRVSGLCAVGMAGVPVVCWPEVSVEAGTAFDTDGFGFVSWREASGTLLAKAEQVTEHTWVSTPARAVLECAQHPYRSHRWEEHVGRMIVNRFDVCSPDEISRAAEALGWRAGLRRLASLADGLARSSTGRELGFDVDPDWAGLCRTSGRGDKWVHLAPLRRANHPPQSADQDDARKVHWPTTPNALALKVST